MMTEHTPGPWKYIGYSVDGDGFGWFVEIAPNRYASAEGRGEGEAEANCRLIAAAPDLLEALEAAEEYFDDRADAETLPDQGDVGNEEMRLMSICREALAKARGDDQ